MGNTPPRMVNFEAIQSLQGILINTMSVHEQEVVIQGTVPLHLEIPTVENAIQTKTPIYIYGKHSNDMTIYKKYEQLKKLGGNPMLYTGGLFEWMLLQEIYGDSNFPTTGHVPKPVDLYKFKP